MTILNHLRRLFFERCIRVISVDLARARDQLDDLEAAYRGDAYNSSLHYDILTLRARLNDLEDERNHVQSRLSEVLAASSS